MKIICRKTNNRNALLSAIEEAQTIINQTETNNRTEQRLLIKSLDHLQKAWSAAFDLPKTEN